MSITRRWKYPPFLFAPDEGASGAEAEAEVTEERDWKTYAEQQESIAKEHQAWGTRLAQEKAELAQEAELARNLRDPEKRAEALAALGLGLVPDEAEDQTAEQIYDNDPRVLQQLQELQARLDRREQQEQQQTAAQQEQANYQAYRQQIADPQLKQMNVPEQLHEVVAGLALELPEIHTPQGPKPDLEGAWKQFLEFSQALDDVPEVQTRRQQKWAASKPSRALVTPNGRAGTEVPDLKTHEGRMAAAMGRIAGERM